jgi:hypothetical protein
MAAMNPKTAAGCVVTLMFIISASYLLFLAASWNAYQSDRTMRDAKLNELLDRLPVKKEAPVVIAEPD